MFIQLWQIIYTEIKKINFPLNVVYISMVR